MALTGTKSAFTSLTIQGALVSLLPVILRLFGFDLGDDAAGISADFINSAFACIGAGLVIYGRIRATQKIGAEPPT